MSKIILLNGPRECGKNAAVDHLKLYYPLKDRRCKDHLYKLTQLFFRISEVAFFKIYNDRLLKEVPLPEFRVSSEAYTQLRKKIRIEFPIVPGDTYDLSIRQAMIYVSECVCKPTFGNDYFGVARADDISEDELAIDDSCGFPEELTPVIERLGGANVLLIRIHGRGDFDGDSRDFIPDGVVDNTLDVHNTGAEKDYVSAILSIAERFYGREHHRVERFLV